MARHYGIPYMRSKQKLVDKIVPFILNRHPDTTHFYDLFGGGGSVALYAVRKYPKMSVHYNELSKAVAGLMSHLKDGGDKPLVYCDPPYEGTAEYREGGFDHKAFYDWVMMQPFPIYVSSYKVSDERFKLVKAVNTRSLLAAAYSDKPSYNYENVYWNGVE